MVKATRSVSISIFPQFLDATYSADDVITPYATLRYTLCLRLKYDSNSYLHTSVRARL